MIPVAPALPPTGEWRPAEGLRVRPAKRRTAGSSFCGIGVVGLQSKRPLDDSLDGVILAAGKGARMRSEHALREGGKIRRAGREYTVQDGDVIHFISA